MAALVDKLPKDAMLEKWLGQYKTNIESTKLAIEDPYKELELLKRRLRQSRRQLGVRFRRIYASADSFLQSIDPMGQLQIEVDGSPRQVNVPLGLAANLRVITQCSEHLTSNPSRIERTRRNFLEASRSVKYSHSEQQRRRRRDRTLRRHERLAYEKGVDAMQRLHQQELERQFLSENAKPFLVEIKRLLDVRRASVASSICNVPLLRPGERPISDWSDIQPVEDVPGNDTGLYSEGLQPWKQSRRAVQHRKTQHNADLEVYLDGLIDHLLAFPRATREDYDTYLEQNYNGLHPMQRFDLHKAALEDLRKFYNEEREVAKADGLSGVLLSPSWAASNDDVDPTQSPTTLYQFQPHNVLARGRTIRRYCRRVARQPSLARHNEGPTTPSSSNPAPSIGSDPIHEEVTDPQNLSAEDRRDRVQRMANLAESIRAQYTGIDGIIYAQSPIMDA